MFQQAHVLRLLKVNKQIPDKKNFCTKYFFLKFWSRDFKKKYFRNAKVIVATLKTGPAAFMLASRSKKRGRTRLFLMRKSPLASRKNHPCFFNLFCIEDLLPEMVVFFRVMKGRMQ